MAEETPLLGGNLSAAVVRVGDTVRRPTGPWTPAVHALLRHLDERGFDGSPRLLGLDEQGREVLEFIEGDMGWPDDQRWPLASTETMARVGRLLRAFHDAVAGFDPGPETVWRFPEMAADAEPFVDERGTIVCHNDPAGWNLVVGPERWAFIDWDTAGPRPPIWDVAYCAIGTVPIAPRDHAVPVVERLRALVDGYGLTDDDRQRLPSVITARIRSSYTHLRRRAAAGIEPWAEMWRNGHGDSWASMLTLAAENERHWTESLVSPQS